MASLADSEGSLARQPNGESAQPDRCQEMGNSVTRCDSHLLLFTHFTIHTHCFGSFAATNILDTLRHRKGTFFRCYNALHQWREYITNLDCKKEKVLSLHHLPYTLILHVGRPVGTSFCVRWIYYQKQGTIWNVLIDQCCWVFVRRKSNCNLTVENSTPAVSAFFVL